MAVDSSENADTGDVEKKIVKQIEYYFGDLNLMRDRFLKEKIQEDNGWVTVETMLKFNRLRQISEDAELIVKALKEGGTGLMEVNEAGDKIRRSPSKPLPGDTKERRDEIGSRTIYAKSFPEETSLDELMSFFECYGPVETVFMKRDFHKKTFKGSVFATFTKKEDAEAFLREEGTKFVEQPLEVKLIKADYFKNKNLQKKKDGKPEAKKEEDPKQAQQSNEEKAKQQMTKSAVLRLEGIEGEMSREDIRNFFSDFGNVGWVDFEIGEKKAYLRLKEPNSAGPTLEKALKAGEGKIVINNVELTACVVEGDEEVEYWTKMFKDIAEKQKQKKAFRGDRRQRGGRRNRGGPLGKRRKDEDNEEEADQEGDAPREKVAKSALESDVTSEVRTQPTESGDAKAEAQT